MAPRRAVLFALGAAVVAAGCGAATGAAPPTTSTGVPSTSATTTTFLVSPPPARVVDSKLVFLDPDGIDREPAGDAVVLIDDEAGVDAFVSRFVEGDPPMDRAVVDDELGAGRVLIGGVISSGCFPADGATVAWTAGEVLVFPTGLDDADHDVACVRPVRSTALLAVDPTDLPAGLPLRSVGAG